MTARVTSSFRSVLVLAGAAIAIVFSGQSTRVKATSALYTVSDLGSLGCCSPDGTDSIAYGLNNNGDVVGVTITSADPTAMVPFVYHNGVMAQIGTAAGWATAINDAGQATGFVYVGGGTSTHAFLYADGVFTDIGGLPGNGNNPGSLGFAINNAGTIVGSSNKKAMIYENGVMSGLKRRGAIDAFGVNDAGDVVGLLEKMSPLAHAFLYSGNNLIDLGTMDGDPNSVSVACGINHNRQIVGTGFISSNSQQRAFLYENGVMKDIGTLSGGYSEAHAINGLGEIAGMSDGSAFVYRNGAMTDLNAAIDKDASGWPKVYYVLAINDHGQIAGSCYLSDPEGNIRVRACLLTPIAP